jgi:hypothetical protein
MVKKVKQKVDPYSTIKQLAGATHTEVQYFLPYLPAWLADDSDPMLADMNSVCAALILYSLDGQYFIPGGKNYTH